MFSSIKIAMVVIMLAGAGGGFMYVKTLKADLEVANEKFNKINASGDRRDVGNLALSKPRSIERIENKRQQQAARCFEIAQGSPLTEEELNATKKSQINAECPNIANPNYVPY